VPGTELMTQPDLATTYRLCLGKPAKQVLGGDQGPLARCCRGRARRARRRQPARRRAAGRRLAGSSMAEEGGALCRSASTTMVEIPGGPVDPDRGPRQNGGTRCRRNSPGWSSNRFRDFRGFRAVPGAIVRRSAYIAPNVVLMPSFVNVGAYVGSGTMVDTWANGPAPAPRSAKKLPPSPAGVGNRPASLEPLQAEPVIIEG